MGYTYDAEVSLEDAIALVQLLKGEFPGFRINEHGRMSAWLDRPPKAMLILDKDWNGYYQFTVRGEGYYAKAEGFEWPVASEILSTFNFN